jgi:hypothetical protein
MGRGTQHHKIYDCVDGITHQILKSQKEAEQFPPTILKT